MTYLVAGPSRLRKRFLQLVWSGLAMFAGAGWWVATLELVPASWRPYVGGSTNNSELNLIFGYNGLGRITGNETGSVGGGVGGGGGRNGTGKWGETGILRLFNSEFGGQASWLIPAALILGAAGLVATARRQRVDRSRAALLLWSSWLFVTSVLLSVSKGILHPYYTVVLAPAIGALVGIGGHIHWQRRHDLLARPRRTSRRRARDGLDAEVIALLDDKASDYTWVLATIGANQASGDQLSTGDPVIAIGGFNGTDPTPTRAAFQAFVIAGRIHYFVAGGTGGTSSDASKIRIWVEASFAKVTVGSSALYDLTAPLG